MSTNKEVWVVGMATNGDTSGDHEESPSFDCDVVDSSLAAMHHMIAILKDSEQWDKAVGESLKRWRDNPDEAWYHDDGMGMVYTILCRNIGEKTVVL